LGTGRLQPRAIQNKFRKQDGLRKRCNSSITVHPDGRRTFPAAALQASFTVGSELAIDGGMSNL
jgi:hypothetical protein